MKKLATKKYGSAFRPNKIKIIFSIIVSLVIFLFVRSSNNSCICSSSSIGCVDQSGLLFYKYCPCNCISLVEVLDFYFWWLVLPLIYSYLIYSVVDMIKREKDNNEDETES